GQIGQSQKSNPACSDLENAARKKKSSILVKVSYAGSTRIEFRTAPSPAVSVSWNVLSSIAPSILCSTRFCASCGADIYIEMARLHRAKGKFRARAWLKRKAFSGLT